MMRFTSTFICSECKIIFLDLGSDGHRTPEFVPSAKDPKICADCYYHTEIHQTQDGVETCVAITPLNGRSRRRVTGHGKTIEEAIAAARRKVRSHFELVRELI